MENRILFKAGLRRHRSSLTGVFVLLLLVSLALGTVLTVWSNSGRYVAAEMERAGFGTLTAWVSNVPDMDALTNEIASLSDVTAVEAQQIIFSNYAVGEQESDSEWRCRRKEHKGVDGDARRKKETATGTPAGRVYTTNICIFYPV